MMSVFDAQRLQDLCVTARRLVDRAIEHEARVNELANLSPEAANSGSPSPSFGLADRTALPASFSVPEALAALHLISGKANVITSQLCTDAREQRELAEALLHSLTADTVQRQSPPPSPVVLVADDSPLVRRVLTRAFADVGVTVATVNNGLEALIAAHERRPILVVMDIDMPVLDGIEAARLLRARLDTTAITIVAHTANADALEGRFPTLFARVLPKSMAPASLVATVLEMIVPA